MVAVTISEESHGPMVFGKKSQGLRQSTAGLRRIGQQGQGGGQLLQLAERGSFVH